MRMGRKDILILVGSMVATVVLSTTALLDFYALNAHELMSATRVVHYAEGTLAAVVVCAGCLRLLLPGFAAWRCLLATGLATFTFYSYDEMERLLRALKVPLGGWLPLSWLAATIAVGVLALIFLRHPRSISVLLVLSMAFSAPSVGGIFAVLANEHRPQSASNEPGEFTAGIRISPNIYWIVLDGYPRQDVLQKDFAFDNSGFVQSLTSLGFTILDRSLSNFPATAYSISSTLSMDYAARAIGERVALFPIEDMYPIVRGKSRTVSSLKGAGYSYVHFENGYDYLTHCGADEPRCVHGNVGLDELDTAILSNTPIIDLIVDWEKLKGKLHSAPFAWGGVEDLTVKLDTIRTTPSPFFLYAHVLAPHPPIRFRSDCSFRPAEPDLQGWNATARPAFIEQLECVNSQTLTLPQGVVQSDPGALIILQSDHGTAFNGQFEKPPTGWLDRDLQERFGVLNALRLPETCRASAVSDLTLVDTFPLVLSCLTGGEFKRHSPRFFVTPYEDSKDFGHVAEYPAYRLQAANGGH
jgi:hypothetical protein